MAHYVQFFRGTPQAYAELLAKNNDTLYFVSDKDGSTAKIYLGVKEITSTFFGTTALADLTDIELGGRTLVTGDILVYDEILRKWTVSDFSSIQETMVGATANAAGSAGVVPAPRAGDENKYLRGDGTWATVDATGLENLRTAVSTLVGQDTGKSVREVASEEVADIVAGAPAAYDTLQEIAAWIINHPDNAAEINSRLTTVERGVSSATNTLDNHEDRLIILEGNIYSGNLNADIAALKAKDISLENAVNALDNRLQWQELVEEDL